MTYLSDKIDVLEKENAKLKEDFKMSEARLNKTLDRKSRIEDENEQLKQDYKQKIDDMKSLADEYHILVDEIIKLKTEIVDHRVKEYRLLKILNETSDYT